MFLTKTSGEQKCVHVLLLKEKSDFCHVLFLLQGNIILMLFQNVSKVERKIKKNKFSTVNPFDM